MWKSSAFVAWQPKMNKLKTQPYKLLATSQNIAFCNQVSTQDSKTNYNVTYLEECIIRFLLGHSVDLVPTRSQGGDQYTASYSMKDRLEREGKLSIIIILYPFLLFFYSFKKFVPRTIVRSRKGRSSILSIWAEGRARLLPRVHVREIYHKYDTWCIDIRVNESFLL